MSGSEDFVISNGELTKYKGSCGDVVIPDSVTTIGYEAFYGCSSLTSIVIPARFTKQINGIFGTAKRAVIHIPDISDVGSKFRPMCAVGFAEDNRDFTDEYGKKYAKYIKTNAVKLIDTALEHPSFLSYASQKAYFRKRP